MSRRGLQKQVCDLAQVLELAAAERPQGRVLLTMHDLPDAFVCDPSLLRIALDERAKVFQKYFRGRSAQNRPGAGLGLYLVQRIVTLHGGTVTLGKAAGGGAVFTLSIPSLKGERPSATP